MASFTELRHPAPKVGDPNERVPTVHKEKGVAFNTRI